MKVLLVGQPNVGKSTLLHALTGAKVEISNYPGTTVDVTEGKATIKGDSYIFLDTPGVYSLTSSSEEEKVTEKLILEGDYDFIIQVVDGTAIERSLITTLQLAELGVPFIMAVNFYDEAKERGVIIDLKALEEILGVPAVRINPLKGDTKELIDRIKEAKRSKFKIRYDDHIEEGITKLEQELNYSGKLLKRGLAVKLLEGSPFMEQFLKEAKLSKIKDLLKSFHPNMESDITISRSGYAVYIGSKVLKITSTSFRSLPAIDRFIIDTPIGGLMFSIGTLILIFLSLFYIGGWLQENLSFLSETLLEALTPFLKSMGEPFNIVTRNIFIGVSAGVSIAIPYVGVFYFILSLLEDSGLLSRFIVALNKVMNSLNLPGKAIIPALLGLGCAVPAIRSTRILPSFTDRLRVSILYMTIPCSSRAAIVFGIVGYYAGLRYALGIYLTALLVFIITAKVMGIIIPRDPLPLIEELPRYRKPQIKNLLLKAWIKAEDFVYVAIPLLALGGFLYGILSHFNMIEPIVKPLRFLTVHWLQLPEKTAIPIIYGFIQKDLVPAMLINAMGTIDITLSMSKLQIFTFGLACVFQIPCMIALLMLIRELGIRRALIIEISAFTYGMLLTGIVSRIVGLLL
ncbi:MAG: ferrous iron transport protein B [Synergistetes bacterium]|nr:ferrous iron transport protein B [Synergistota bacterium]MDW8191721.1 ferrous iron transport protein B [Synergistota bacterium]